MSIDGSVAPEQALSADNAGFNCFAGLHDRKQRNHATQGKVDAINGGALFVEHDVRAKLHRREPSFDGFEFVNRKLPQNTVLYDVLWLHMPASVAPSVGQRPRHGNWTRRITPAAGTYAPELCLFVRSIQGGFIDRYEAAPA